MATLQQDRPLRLITIASWVPAMALLIPYGVRTNTAFPALGLIPLSMSVVVGLAKLHVGASLYNYTVYMDALIAVLLLCFTVPGFPMRWPEMGTFAVCPLFINMCLHTFFVLRDSGVLASLEDMLRPRTCQYCHRDLQTMWAMKMENQNQNQNSLKTDNSVAAPVQLATQAQPSAPEAETASISAPTARPASISPSNFTAPRPSTDYDAETLRSVDATIRSPSPYKARDSGEVV